MITVPRAIPADVREASPRAGELARHLAAFGARRCLRDVGRWLSAADVADELVARRDRYGAGRRLVHLVPEPTTDRILDQLAALDAGHVVMLAAASQASSLATAWNPDTVVTDGGVDIRRERSAHRLHPDLALLLSTSGSTGSPKLVRLSARNLAANARSVAESLGLTADDCGISSLPLHYCYGLSVLHSHLAVGAGVQLTGASVVDPCFWNAVEEQGVTSLAAVPYTFELLDRVGLDRIGASSIRVVTQAGGRLDPERVRDLAAVGERAGWDLRVMYGQTEATARIACMPAGLAGARPEVVGRAVPGGSIEIRCPDSGRSLPAGDVGRVVYSGPNVMMGYATEPAHLADPARLDELVTGDLGSVDADGLLRITGRESRFAKLFGLRVDLQRVEQHLADAGVTALIASDDERLAVLVAGETSRGDVAGPGDGPIRDDGAAPDDGAHDDVGRLVVECTGLPRRVVDVGLVHELPRTSAGKPDFAAVLELVPPATDERRADGVSPASSPPSSSPSGRVAAAFRQVLGDDADPGASFVDRGGDSLSYVELSVRLEELVGSLPTDWHLRPVAELEALAARRRSSGAWSRRFARTDTTIALRATAILLIVSTHMAWFDVPVGAHVLLVVAGYNFARFQLADTARPGWLASAAAPFAKIAVVASAWIALQMWWFGGHSLGTVLLVNSYLGDPGRTEWRWRYWYVEAIVHIGIVLLAVLAWGRVRALERRWGLWFPLALLAPALLLRFDVVQIGGTRNDIFRADTVLWLVLLGWAIQRTGRLRERVLVSLVALATVPGYFWHDERSARLLVGVLVLAWVPWVPIPRPLNRVVGVIASASLAIYLTHYAVFPALADRDVDDRIAFPIVIAVGVVTWWVVSRSAPPLQRWVSGRGRSRSVHPGR